MLVYHLKLWDILIKITNANNGLNNTCHCLLKPFPRPIAKYSMAFTRVFVIKAGISSSL